MRWPPGFSSAGVACGIKATGDLDLGLLVAARPVAWAGTFTRNAAAAAPVRWCRTLTGRRVRAIVVNSGNANACTGDGGEAAVLRTASLAASTVGCSFDEVLVASTGIIGTALPVEKVRSGLKRAVTALGPGAEDFARAILTTDTCIKTVTAAAGCATVVGVAKGAAMVAPNMATMLAFIATDAAVPTAVLQASLDGGVARSFNRISIDACESTNDSVFLLASGEAEGVDEGEFARAVQKVCGELSAQIVADAEGATRVVAIKVKGAADERTAAELARAVAASCLWRAAAHGSDPNWGRVLAALGSVERSLELAEVSVVVGGETLFSSGEPAGDVRCAAEAMQADRFEVSCVVGSGSGEAEILSCDLSEEYVRLNAEGMT